MAVTTPRRQAKDPEGRMPLREHLRELRRRVIIATIAILAGAIAGWFLYEPVMTNLIINPVKTQSSAAHPITFQYSQVADAFTIKVKVSAWLGIIFSSPIWLWQIWGFITPGLTRKERRYSMVFIAAAVPLFLSGVAMAIWVFPKAITFTAEFSLDDTVNLPQLGTTVDFALRLIIAMGVAFLMPLFLVGLNLAGFLSSASLGKHWRIAVFIAFLFSAIVSPSPDPIHMIILALPLVALYCLALGICILNDRRRARRAAAELAALGDDEATPLDDLIGSDIGSDPHHGDPIEPPGPLDDTSADHGELDGDRRRPSDD
jgi:sec-independent protein translocase protein TatC